MEKRKSEPTKGVKIAAGVITAIIMVFVLAGLSSGGKENTKEVANAQPSAATEVKSTTKEEPSVPAEYRAALAKADSYANIQHMSKAGLYNQLTSEFGEQFSKEAAQYAVDNVKTDWNANALAKARSYQEDQSMSPTAIHNQLTSQYGEKFTAAEADYAIAHLNE